MYRVLSLEKIRQQQTPEELENNRQKTLEACARFKEAQADLEKRCEELGIEIPVLVCAA